MTIRIAGAQIPVTLSIADNHAVILHAIEFAASSGASILLTPEGSLSGYAHVFDQDQTEEALTDICKVAAGHHLALAIGTCFVEADGKCYNQLRFYDADGSYLGFHSKTLTCGTVTGPPDGEVQHFSVAPLRLFRLAGVVCGGLICNDLWANPMVTPMPDTHLTQQLSAMGARIVFHAVNGGRDDSEFSTVVNWNFHESNLRMRARAGGLYVVTVDNCFPSSLSCSSPGGVVGPSGEWLIQCPAQGEQYFVYDIDLDQGEGEI